MKMLSVKSILFVAALIFSITSVSNVSRAKDLLPGDLDKVLVAIDTKFEPFNDMYIGLLGPAPYLIGRRQAFDKAYEMVKRMKDSTTDFYSLKDVRQGCEMYAHNYQVIDWMGHDLYTLGLIEGWKDVSLWVQMQINGEIAAGIVIP